MNIAKDESGFLSAGDLFGQTLADLGVNTVFAIVGSHINQLLAGCQDRGIRIVDTRHESTAGHAVEGYAKATGLPGVCIVTAGPGFTNALTAMMSCFVDAAPGIFVAGASPQSNGGPNPLQGGFSQLDMARPVAKRVASASHAGEIPALLRQAWSLAQEGRPGPVFIEIPADVAASGAIPPLPAERAAQCATGGRLEDAAMERLVDCLSSARKPMLLAGGGMKYAGAHRELAQLAERLGLPVLTNFDSHGVLPADSPYWCGSLNLISRLPLVAECDLLLVLGARFGLLTGGIPGRFCHPALIIVQVDINPAELDHLRPTDLGIAACCGDFLAELNAHLPRQNFPCRKDWLLQFRNAGEAMKRPWEKAAGRPGLLHPYQLAKWAVNSLPRHTTFVVDGGDTKHWLEMNLSPQQPGQYISRAYSGALGSGQGLALGAYFARQDAPLCLFIGDGAWGFHLQEVDTYVRHGVPVIVIIVNNGGWGSIRHIQQKLWKNERYLAIDLGFSRYDLVAAGFGCPSRRVDSLDGLTVALHEALACGGPFIIDALTDPEPDPFSPP